MCFPAGALLSALCIILLSQETGVGVVGWCRVVATHSVLFLKGNCKHCILKRKPGMFNHPQFLLCCLRGEWGKTQEGDCKVLSVSESEENKVLSLWISPTLQPSATSLRDADFFSQGANAPLLLSLQGVISSQDVKISSQPWKTAHTHHYSQQTQKLLQTWCSGPEVLGERSL